MKTSEEIIKIVKEKYGSIAKQGFGNNKSSCCGGEYSVFADDYSDKEGYVAEADLGLGCGLPTEFADIKQGDSVVDLGSGAGNDAFIARSIVGEKGTVIGIDFTPEMIERANRNKEKSGYINVEFHLAELDSTPLEHNTIDVVISNCVLNLSPDKEKAFSEIYRILKPGAHFCVSDVVLKGKLPAVLRKSAEMYAGCVAGALQEGDYLGIISKAGFHGIEIKKTRRIELPEEILKEYLSEEELFRFRQGNIGIFSITVVGYKK